MLFRILYVLLKPVRVVLGAIFQAYDRLSTPKALVSRSPERQAEVDRELSSLALYQFQSCPYCMKVRRHAATLGLKLELRDARQDERHARDLVAGGGELQVPCLRIADASGGVRWMYESTDINAYLSERFAR